MTKNNLIPYNSKLKVVARGLRKNSTLPEILLWNELKGKKMLGLEFHRQVPLDNFTVDFYCHELHLAIEIDGNSHNDKVLEDAVRQNRLESLGVRIWRFDDGQPKKDMTIVLRTIQYWVEEKTSPLPPSKGRAVRFVCKGHSMSYLPLQLA